MIDRNIYFGKESWWQTEDAWIEVLHLSSVKKRIVSYFFRASEIDHLEALEDNKSLTFLKSGTKITLNLPVRELAEKMDKGLSPLDLKEYCEALPAEPESGDLMEDGTILAGISPDTGRPMYVTPADAPSKMDFNEAAAYARRMEYGGKKDFRLPTIKELNILFQNRYSGALKDTFKTVGSDRDGEYRSSEAGSDNSDEYAETMDFLTGTQHCTGSRFSRTDRFNVRCVRG